MLINHEIITDIQIHSIMDVHKLKYFEEESNMKVNKSKLARQLDVDRRTVAKYTKGYQKPMFRKRKSQFDDYFPIIEKLLEDPQKVFVSKQVLWQDLKDNYQLPGATSSFRIYRVSLHKTREILFHLLNESFEVIGGVPKQIVTDICQRSWMRLEPLIGREKSMASSNHSLMTMDFSFILV